MQMSISLASASRWEGARTLRGSLLSDSDTPQRLKPLRFLVLTGLRLCLESLLQTGTTETIERLSRCTPRGCGIREGGQARLCGRGGPGPGKQPRSPLSIWATFYMRLMSEGPCVSPRTWIRLRHSSAAAGPLPSLPSCLSLGPGSQRRMGDNPLIAGRSFCAAIRLILLCWLSGHFKCPTDTCLSAAFEHTAPPLQPPCRPSLFQTH